MDLAVGHAATIGARANQEDSAGLWFPPDAPGAPPDNGTVLAVLADGMGGHAGGAVASAVACSTFIQVFEASGGSLRDRMERALDLANGAISDHVAQDQRLNGMGSTLVAAFVDRDGVRWLSVGDSLLYLYRNGQLQRLNDDHSLGRLLDLQAERNQISFEEAKAHRHRNALRSALTGRALEIVDRHHEPLRLLDGDWLLLASDGIATLEDREIAAILERNLRGDPDDVAGQIIAAVDRRAMAGQDNTTLVLVKAGDGSTYDPNPTRVVRSSRIIGSGAEIVTRPKRQPTEGGAPPPAGETRGGWFRAFGLAVLGLAVMLLALVGGVTLYRSLTEEPRVIDTGPKATPAATEAGKDKPRKAEEAPDKADKERGAGKIDSKPEKSEAPKGGGEPPKPESGEGGGSGSGGSSPPKSSPPAPGERGPDRDKPNSKQGGLPKPPSKAGEVPAEGGSGGEPPPSARPDSKWRGRRQAAEPPRRFIINGIEICKGAANDAELCRCLREEMSALGPGFPIPVEVICRGVDIPP